MIKRLACELAMPTETTAGERIEAMLKEVQASAYQRGWDDAIEHFKSLPLQSLQPPDKKERLRMLLYPLTHKQGLKGAMETGPTPKSRKEV